MVSGQEMAEFCTIQPSSDGVRCAQKPLISDVQVPSAEIRESAILQICRERLVPIRLIGSTMFQPAIALLTRQLLQVAREVGFSKPDRTRAELQRSGKTGIEFYLPIDRRPGP